MTVSEVKAIAQGSLENIAFELLPQGKKSGNRWIAGSTGGEPGKSLSFVLSGANSGSFKDFNEGTKGDVIELWSLCRGIEFLDALNELKAFLHITDITPKKISQKSYARPDTSNLKKPQPKDPVTKYLTEDRGITEQTIKDMRISIAAHAKNGPTIVFASFSPDTDEPTLLKYLAVERNGGKKVTWISKDSKPHLYGWNSIPKTARDVIITEGELDQATAHQWGFPALSLPMGVNGLDWIENDYGHLERFERIFLCFDNDDAGEEAFESISNRLGKDRCFKVVLQHKDLNAMLLDFGTKEEFQVCLDEAKTIDPKEIARVNDFASAVTETMLQPEDTIGSECPWNIPWRIRGSEITLWTGINSHGKTIALSQVMVHDMWQGHTCCIASPEMPVKKQIAIAVRQALGYYPKTAHQVKLATDWLHDKMIFVNYEGDINYKDVIKQFTYAHKRYGCTRFLVDSLLYMVSTEELKDQKAVVVDFRQFSKEYDVHTHIVAHARKGVDENTAPGKMDISGSVDLSNVTDNGISIWRNKAKEKGEETKVAGDATFNCFKQRETGIEPFTELYFKKHANTFAQTEMEQARKYVASSYQQTETTEGDPF